MDLQFRVGKQIPREWRALEPGLHFFDRMENFVFLEEHKGVRQELSSGRIPKVTGWPSIPRGNT